MVAVTTTKQTTSMGADQQQLDRLRLLNRLGIALSAEHNSDQLLISIVESACALTHADGGSLYLRTENQTLEFEIMITNSLGIAWNRSQDQTKHPYSPLSLYLPDGKPNEQMAATYAALNRKAINIADIHQDTRFDFSGSREFDRLFGYHCQSILTVPMVNHEDEVIGVLQLINAQVPDTHRIIPFSVDDQELVESLASQAAVALSKQSLITEQRLLFESLIRVLGDVIDERSPFTAGHSKRVSALALMLADAASASDGLLSDFTMSAEDRYELQIAGWLHDCGKITTPDHLLNKATKLETRFDRIRLIELRFELLKRDAYVNYLEAKENSTDAGELSLLEHTYNNEIRELEEDFGFLQRVNIGGEFLEEDAVARIHRIAQRQWQNPQGESLDLLDEEEITYLSVRRGTLTQDERVRVNHHAQASLSMLEGLNFPRYLRNVTEYACGHHEHIDGSGYPRGLTGDQMSIPARIMAIADFFEAVTAQDRPYREPTKISKALAMLEHLKEIGHLDPNLVNLFIEHKVYLQFANSFLHPDQIDEPDYELPPYQLEVAT